MGIGAAPRLSSRLNLGWMWKPALRTGERAEAEPVAADHDVVAAHPVALRVEQQPYPLRFHRRHLAREAEQDDTDGPLAEAYDELTEVGIIGQQYPVPPVG